MKTLNERLKKLAKDRGAKHVHKYLSEEVGLDKNKVTRVINGEYSSLKYDDLLKISNHFKVSTDYLLGLTDIETPARKLAEKQMPEAPLISKFKYDTIVAYYCPDCQKRLGIHFKTTGENFDKKPYCPYCGKKIDWSGYDE